MNSSAPGSLFTGVEEVPEHLKLDTGSLNAFLRENIDGYGCLSDIKKFRGGQSNPTYALSLNDGRRLVLRRKPPGKLIPTAHAIDREFRIISVMRDAGIPVPVPYVYCKDEGVVGTEFYVTAYVDNRIFWDPRMPDVLPEHRAAAYDDVNRWLARIHSLDYEALGLADWGRGENYAARNLKRWSEQYKKAETRPIPDMDWLIAALAERVPQNGKVALLHGDYGLYNIMLDPVEPKVVAIIDWEMSTLGDPLVDLAHHIRPWWLIADPANPAPTLAGSDLESIGIPSMSQYVDTYRQRSGIRSLDLAGFYLTYAQFRYAAMMQGVIRRKVDGTGANKSVPYTEDRVEQIAHHARALLEGHRTA